MFDIQQCKPLLHVSSRFPANQGCLGLVAPIMQHPVNKNSIICYDLSADPEPLFQLSADEITKRVFTPNDALPEHQTRIPLKEIHLNKSLPLLQP